MCHVLFDVILVVVVTWLLLYLYLFGLFVGILHFVFLNILQNAPNLKFDSCNLWHALKIASVSHGMGKWQPRNDVGIAEVGGGSRLEGGRVRSNIDVCALGRGCLTVLLPPCCQSKVKVFLFLFWLFLFVEVSPLAWATCKTFWTASDMTYICRCSRYRYMCVCSYISQHVHSQMFAQLNLIGLKRQRAAFNSRPIELNCVAFAIKIQWSAKVFGRLKWR